MKMPSSTVAHSKLLKVMVSRASGKKTGSPKLSFQGPRLQEIKSVSFPKLNSKTEGWRELTNEPLFGGGEGLE